MALSAAKLIVEVEARTQAAQQQLAAFGATLDATGKKAQSSGTGFAALDRHALNAGQRAQAAGANFASMGKGVDAAGKQAATAGASMAKAGDGANKAGAGAKNASGAVTGLGSAFSKTNLMAVAAGTGMVGLAAGVGMTAKAAVQAGIDYESAFAGVEKTVDGTQAELAELSGGIRDMAMSMPLAATEIAGVAEAAGALGVAQGDILEFTRVASLIGVTTDVSADQAATSLGQLSNVLGLTNADYEKFGSTLVALGNDGASTESAILGITERAGAAGELIGFATEETLAWGSAVANLGIEVDAGGTALQTFFITTAKQVAAAGDELDILAETAGMTADAFAQAYAEDASAALETFITGLGELDQAQQLATLSALGFNDSRITRTLLGLASNNDNLTNSLKTSKSAWQDNTAMAAEAEKRFATTESQIQLMKNSLNDAAISMSTVLLPAIVDISGGIADMAQGFSQAVEYMQEPDPIDFASRWEEAADRIAGIEVPMPVEPEDTSRRYGHMFSDLMGHDWDGLWAAMFPPKRTSWKSSISPSKS